VLGFLASKKGVYLPITQQRPFTAVRLGFLASKKGVYLPITQHRPFTAVRPYAYASIAVADYDRVFRSE